MEHLRAPDKSSTPVLDLCEAFRVANGKQEALVVVVFTYHYYVQGPFNV
jgi:hypothetical protein